INGAAQLFPSKGCSLFLASVQLGPAGAGSGFSLPEKVESLLKLLSSGPALIRRFTSALESYGLRKAELAHYPQRFSLRRPLALIPVDKKFPAISRRIIQKA